MDNTTVGGFFYRGPVLPPEHMISGRSTLISDSNGDFLPDNAPQDLVDSILAAGLNPSDYIRTAENEISYVLQDSINPSLGGLSPTTFNPGTLTQQESGINVDFIKTFDNSPLNLAFGAEWRNETYKIGAGDSASFETGPTFIQFGVGSDGFQGFTPEQAGKWEKDSIALYVDAETDFTDQFSGAVAARYEDHDGFSTTFDWKLSGRFQFNDAFAVRGTINTGFRVPTPGQVNTLNLTTSADTHGNLIPSGFYPVDHPVAQSLGAAPQTTEESQSYSIGLVWNVADNVSITLDYYDIQIDDRIGALNKTVDQAAVDTLNAQGFPNADLLLGSAASYFSNAFDSDISGVDLAIDASYDVGGGALNVSFHHNYNKQKVNNIKPGTINDSRAFDLENQVPNNRSILTFDYAKDRWGGLVRFNSYGGWESTGGIFSPGDASDASEYGGEVLIDLEARFQFNDTFSVAVGGDNIFDTFPDKEQDGVFQFLGVIHSITSPFGFNGAFWYVRGSVSF
jgi:iron complex outermembrane receptor protein